MKKAMAVEKMVIAVIVIVLIIVFVIFLVKVRIGTLNILEDSECKSNIATHVMLLKTTGEAIVTDVYCPTKYYTIPKESDEQIKYHLAEALKTCWGTWGKGELRLFAEDGYFCHICSVVDFKDKNRMINGFDDYLKQTPYKQDSSTTYLEYLTGFESENANPAVLQYLEQVDLMDTIDTSKPYASIFVYVKGSSNVKKFFDNADALHLGTIGGGATVGVVVGTAGAVVGSALASGGISLLVLGGYVLTNVAVGAVVGAAASDDIAWTATAVIAPYDVSSLKNISCEISPVQQVKKDAVT
ncbi:MAG TPA: hypothetical protein VJ461_06895 [Candidatus Nanoarchaeia archaeon]|nr:hypothetical protein [Candidatus Nanoarchaeia archaeon]